VSRLQLGDTTGARADIAEALRRAPPNSAAAASIRALQATLERTSR
jgi:hypothetical protein